MFSRSFCKYGVPFSNYMHIYKKGDIVEFKGVRTVKKRHVPQMLSWQVKACNITWNAVHITVNKRVKGKILAMNVHTNIQY